MIFWDMPYGMNLAAWDVLLPDADVESLFQQLAVINRATAHCLVLGCIWHDLGRMRVAMLANGYCDVHVLGVYKPQQNTTGFDWINALELMVVGYKGGMKACKLTFAEMNPVFRHNVFFSHQVGPKRRFPGEDVPVNTTQKTPIVASHLGRIMCQPGTRALVLGAGSGSEVVGLARVGVNVVAVERDYKQFRALAERLTTEAAYPADALKQLADAEESIALLSALAANFTKLNRDLSSHFATFEDNNFEAEAEAALEHVASSSSADIKADCASCGQPVSPPDAAKCQKMGCPTLHLHANCLVSCSKCSKGFCSPLCCGDHDCP